VAVGIPFPGTGDAYYEVASLADLESTLRTLGFALVGAAALTTVIGVFFGRAVARRTVRPLAEAARAAEAIAGGRLDTRLDPADDRDLQVLSTAFNHMAQALEERIARDARFASDVSHELRSPLMTLAASVEVMQSRRDEMPERAQAALDLLVDDLARFHQLVEDLLEISRYDAGSVRLVLDEVDAAEFVRQALTFSSDPDVPVLVDPRAEGVLLRIDKRRIAQVVANLIDNARAYAGGASAVKVEVPPGEPDPPGSVRIAVEDRGPGVPDDERELIFQRFARGSNAGRRGRGEGTGLGLALVGEHVRLHGGSVWVEPRADGGDGARFVVTLPAVVR
jgi:signal transduction histidine kinase